MTWMAAIVAGGVGAVARWAIAHRVEHGVTIVNVLGSGLLGALLGLEPSLDGGVLLVAGSGFLGGFTTFSTWMVEVAAAGGEDGSTQWWSVLVPLGAGLAAVAAGRWMVGVGM